MSNLFIALEGIDGSGKSTQAKLLAERLKAEGHKVYLTFEPTDGKIGKMIRAILRGESKADERTIAALFVADRLDHLLNEEDGLVKKLKDGYTVITDRYYFSSYAYHGTHIDMQWVIDANKMAAQVLRPDVNVFIDITPEMAMQRVTKNRGTTELYETLENLTNVRVKFLEAFELLNKQEQIVFINGAQDIHAISNDIYEQVKKLTIPT